MRSVLCLIAVISCAGSSRNQPPPMAVGNGKTCKFGGVKIGAVLGDPELRELSGLAASRKNANVLFANNDSGDAPRFFAMDLDGKALGQFELDGATAIDWEDMAVGPCGTDSCVFLGDIGDNRRVRDDYAIYRVPEPAVTRGATKVTWDRLRFSYPEGAQHNAETLLVHPINGTPYVVTKQSAGEPSVVFRFPMPLDPSRQVTLIPVATLAVPDAKDQALTGGAISPDGSALLLRMYNRLVELKLPSAAPFEDVFKQAAVNVPVAAEQQGEAVTWRADGRGYFTASEEVGVKPTLNRVECQP